jgi:hypothetical protein
VAAVTADSGVTATCNDSSSAWAATGKLSTAHFWCVDSTGVSKDEGTTDIGTAKAC